MASMVPDRLLSAIPRESSDRELTGGWTPQRVRANDRQPRTKPKSPDFPRRVLLVDPSYSECARLRNELIAGQLEVYTATDLITAVHALSNFQPNLVLRISRLPTYSGMELVRRVTEGSSTRSIPVILYTDISTADERVKALDLGAADVLSKPFGNAELIARVARCSQGPAYAFRAGAASPPG